MQALVRAWGGAKYYAGIDAHRSYLTVAIVDGSGALVRERKRVPMGDGEPLLEALEGLRPLKAVVETCSFWPWIHDTLEPTEVSFHLAHASGVEAIAKSDAKTDEIDAWMLARLLSVGLVPEVWAKPEEQRELVRTVRYRKELVRDRTKVANRIHGHLHAQGLEIGRERLLRNKGSRWFEEKAWAWLSEEQRRVVESYLRLIDAVTEEIQGWTRGSGRKPRRTRLRYSSRRSRESGPFGRCSRQPSSRRSPGSGRPTSWRRTPGWRRGRGAREG